MRIRQGAPTALLVLSFVPVAAGSARVAQLTSGAKIMPVDTRYAAVPGPVVLHIVCASLFCVLGAFQFAAGFRRRRPGWHRVTGRLLVLCGLATALSGIWLVLFLPRRPGQIELLSAFRLMAGTGMALSIALGFVAIRRRDFASHRAWMIRGYAIGQGAGTQAVTLLSWALLFGPFGGLTNALLHGASWAINLGVAELIIRRSRRRRQRRQTTTPTAFHVMEAR